jgi:hypothetical protein
MPEVRKLHLPMSRAPLGDLDPADLEGARQWVIGAVTQRVVQGGGLPPGLRFFTDTALEHVDLSELAVGEEDFVGWFFRELSRRPGVRLAFREGEVQLPDGEGNRRRSAAVLEVDWEEGRYRLVWRHFGERALHVGVLHGDWQREEGPLDELTGTFLDWVDAGGVERGEVREQAQPTELPDVAAAFAELPEEPQWAPGPLAEVVGRVTDHDLVNRGLEGVLVLILRGRTVEKWIVEGRLPCTVDDVVRSLTRLERCDAAVLIVAGVARVDGEDQRAFIETIECRGQRGQRVVPLEQGADGRLSASRALYRSLPAPPEGEGWIGVEPEVVLQLAPFTLPGGTAEG